MNDIIGESFYFQIYKNEDYELKTDDEFKHISKSAYNSAVGFYIISQKCIDMLLSNYNNQICSIIAFSCELFLKSVLFRNKIDCRKEHDLYRLYKLLENEEQETIKNMHKCGNIKREDFELNLKEIGKAFIILRYSYEKKRLAYNLQFLMELIMALNEFCTNIYGYNQ